MATGMPGHNRGKKWVPGIGYRFPKQQSVPQRVCDGCGSTDGIVYVRVVGVRPLKTIALCEVCAKELDE